MPLFWWWWWCNHMCDGKAFKFCLYLIPSTFSKNGWLRLCYEAYVSQNWKYNFSAQPQVVPWPMTWPALNSAFLKHKRTWRPCRRTHRWSPLNRWFGRSLAVQYREGFVKTVLFCLQVFNKLIRRYKYLEKGFEEEIKKVCIGELYWNKRHISKSRWWVPEHCIAVQCVYI